MVTRTQLVLCSVAGLLVALASGAQPAAAAPVNCGDTIKADTKLTADLVDCPNNGIEITADNVTLDLNGHTIDGDGKPTKPCPKNGPCDFGVVNDGHVGVVIEGGSLKQFATGVIVVRAERNLLKGLTASRNRFNGVVIAGSTRTALRRSRVVANGLETDYPGIAVVDSSEILIRGTTSNRNADLGLWVVDSANNRFVHNTFANNPEAGIISDSDHTEIIGNRVARNGDGIISEGSGNTIARNQVLRSLGCGKGCGIGISVESGHHNLVANNVVRNAKEIGIRLDTFVHSQQLGDNVVRRNQIQDAGETGLFVGEKTDGTTLARNHVRRSGRDGIHIENPATALIRNHANRNGGLGIDAVAGVIDGGGNGAAGNGNPEQCKNVACT